MTFADLFRLRRAPAPRTSCPFCPGPLAATPSARLCNVCSSHALGKGVSR